MQAGMQFTGQMFQARAGQRAAQTSGDAAAAQGNLQNYMYQQSRADLAPYRHIGTQALNALGELYGFSGWQGGTDIQAGSPFSTRQEKHNIWKEGLSSGLTPGTRIDFNAGALGGSGVQSSGGATGATGQPNYDRFLNSPDYQFALEQGLEASNKQAAASGRLRSGGQMKALTRYGQGMASQQLGSYFNRLASMAGIGQTATSQGVASGQGYANSMSNAIGNAGGAAAAGQLYRGNVIGQGFNSMANSSGYNSGGGGSSTALFGGSDYSNTNGNGWGDDGYDYGSTGDNFNWGG